jgi:hypothetical protein
MAIKFPQRLSNIWQVLEVRNEKSMTAEIDWDKPKRFIKKIACFLPIL